VPWFGVLAKPCLVGKGAAPSRATDLSPGQCLPARYRAAVTKADPAQRPPLLVPSPRPLTLCSDRN